MSALRQQTCRSSLGLASKGALRTLRRHRTTLLGGFLALAAAGVIGGLALNLHREGKRAAAERLEAILDRQEWAVETWYAQKQEMLSRLREATAGRRDELPALATLCGFSGYAVVDRDGKVRTGTSESAQRLLQDAAMRSVAQSALTGRDAATGVQPAPEGTTDGQLLYIAIATPIWPKSSSEERNELTLPSAALLAWFSPPNDFPLLAKGNATTAGERVSLLQTAGGPKAERGTDFTALWKGTRVVRAWRKLPQRPIVIAAELDRREVDRPLTAALLPLGLAGVVAAAGAGLLVFLGRRSAARWGDTAAKGERRIGPYRIEGMLGEGGMGVVYLGKHVLMQRDAAIKVLDKRRADETCILRFEREVQMTAKLSHPNTIMIYDYGLTEEGDFYYAMEYIDGLSLDKLIEQGPLSEGRTIHLLAQLCGSLNEAHQMGLIHRDIKPANVLVTTRGGLCDFVKLVDFGLVKAVQARSAAITGDGLAVGTPLFMSPEAIETPDDVDARSDLYSVGAIGYYLLTGKYVFVGKSSPEVCMKHLQERPTPPSVRSHRPISADLEHLILQCLEKDRENRPPTAFDLQQSLLACREAFTWTEDEAEEWWLNRQAGEKKKDGDRMLSGVKRSLVGAGLV